VLCKNSASLFLVLISFDSLSSNVIFFHISYFFVAKFQEMAESLSDWQQFTDETTQTYGNRE